MLLVFSLALNVAAGYWLRSELGEAAQVIAGGDGDMLRGGNRERRHDGEERGRLIKRSGGSESDGRDGFVELHVVGNGSVEGHGEGEGNGHGSEEDEIEIELELVEEL